MKCIGEKCPKYFESDNRASCDLCYNISTDTECPIDKYVDIAYQEFIEIEMRSEIIRENQKG